MARHRRFGRRARLGSARLVGVVALTVTAATGLAARSPDGPTGTTGTLSALNAASTTERPDFVLILADDLDQMTSPYWDAMPHTAALIRDSGPTFTDGFALTQICCPARGTILTGRYGHNTGVLTNAGDVGGWATFAGTGNKEHTFAKYLSDAGYRTGLDGKYMDGIEDAPTHIPPGWSEWYGSVDNNFYTGYNYTLNDNGTLVPYGGTEDPANYSTGVAAAKSTDFIRLPSWSAIRTEEHLYARWYDLPCSSSSALPARVGSRVG